MAQEEITIDLLDVLKRLLSNWKKILIVCFIFAIIFGAYGAYKGNKAYNDRLEFLEKYADEDVYDEFTFEELSLIEDYSDYIFDSENKTILRGTLIELNSAMAKYEQYKVDIKDDQNYLDESVYLKLDPEHYLQRTLTYTIKLVGYNGYDVTSVISTIESYISNNLYNDTDLDKINVELGYNVSELRFLNGLISRWASDNTYYISITAPTESDIDYITELIKSNMEELSVKIENGFLEYSAKVELLGEKYTDTVNKGILTSKQSYLDEIAEIYASINEISDTSNGISENAGALFDEMRTLRIIESDNPELYAKKLSRDLIDGKMIIIGFILGGVLICCWLIGKPLVKGTLMSVTDIEGRYRITLFGSLKKAYIDSDVRVLSKNAEVTIKKKEYKTIYLNTMNDDNLFGIAKIVRGILEESGINVIENTKDMEANIEKFSESDACLFICERDVTKYKDMSKLMDLSKRVGTEIIGAIVLE